MAEKKYAPQTTEDLKIVARKQGAGIGLYIKKEAKGSLGLELGMSFSGEAKIVKGVKTIILREVEK